MHVHLKKQTNNSSTSKAACIPFLDVLIFTSGDLCF